jgi:hypothetical protein
MKKRIKKYGNPIAKALNKVNKPVTMVDKKKEINKLKCRGREIENGKPTVH